MIKPTVGRVILFTPGSDFTGVAPSDGSPLPALISRVWNDRLINIGGFDADGKPFSATSVPLIQGDETGPVPGSYYAEWMPYQKGQAAKTETLEASIGLTATAVSGTAADHKNYQAHDVAAVAARSVPFDGDAESFGKQVATVYKTVYEALI